MAAISITSSTNNVICTVTSTSPCGAIIYITYKLYQNGSLYTSQNINGTSHTFTSVPVGYNYYVIIDIYTAGPTFCTSATSNTISITNYCIPIGATNMSMSKLGGFYGLTITNVLLSGTNNPSTSGTIFGNSDLPTSGSPSKLRPNAISELRNRCGGAFTWDFWTFELAFSNTSTTACQLGFGASTMYFTNNINLSSTTSLWTDAALTTKVVSAAGYYSNGYQWIQINSSGDVISSGDCPL